MTSAANRLRAAIGLGLALSGAVALGIAYYAQYGLGMVPCDLCFLERTPWRVLIGVGVLAALLRGMPRVVAYGAGLVCLIASIALAVLHGGVEKGWWPSPFAACRLIMPHGRTAAERFANMPLQAAKPCDAPNYLWHLPISMTVLGGLYAFVVLIVASAALWRLRRA